MCSYRCSYATSMILFFFGRNSSLIVSVFFLGLGEFYTLGLFKPPRNDFVKFWPELVTMFSPVPVMLTWPDSFSLLLSAMLSSLLSSRVGLCSPPTGARGEAASLKFESIPYSDTLAGDCEVTAFGESPEE